MTGAPRPRVPRDTPCSPSRAAPGARALLTRSAPAVRAPGRRVPGRREEPTRRSACAPATATRRTGRHPAGALFDLCFVVSVAQAGRQLAYAPAEGHWRHGVSGLPVSGLPVSSVLVPVCAFAGRRAVLAAGLVASATVAVAVTLTARQGTALAEQARTGPPAGPRKGVPHKRAERPYLPGHHPDCASDPAILGPARPLASGAARPGSQLIHRQLPTNGSHFPRARALVPPASPPASGGGPTQTR
ncbi:hypothetical protein JCM4914_44050 [Streptomyces platensis subsp. malvinus]